MSIFHLVLAFLHCKNNVRKSEFFFNLGSNFDHWLRCEISKCLINLGRFPDPMNLFSFSLSRKEGQDFILKILKAFLKTEKCCVSSVWQVMFYLRNFQNRMGRDLFCFLHIRTELLFSKCVLIVKKRFLCNSNLFWDCYLLFLNLLGIMPARMMSPNSFRNL